MKPQHFKHIGWFDFHPGGSGTTEIFAAIDTEPAFYFRHDSGDILSLPNAELQVSVRNRFGAAPRLCLAGVQNIATRRLRLATQGGSLQGPFNRREFHSAG